MRKIGVGMIVVLFVILAGLYVFDKMRYKEPHQTNLYCLASSSDSAEHIRQTLERGAREQGMELADRSETVANELDELNQPRPNNVVHGNIYHNGDLVLSYSNIGSNDHILHLSFYSDEYELVAQSFDEIIKEAVNPRLTRTISGGAFDDRICEGG